MAQTVESKVVASEMETPVVNLRSDSKLDINDNKENQVEMKKETHMNEKSEVKKSIFRFFKKSKADNEMVKEKMEKKMEEKMEEKSEEKMEEKSEEKMEEKMEKKIEEKLEEKLAEMKKEMNNVLNVSIPTTGIDDILEIGEPAVKAITSETNEMPANEESTKEKKKFRFFGFVKSKSKSDSKSESEPSKLKDTVVNVESDEKNPDAAAIVEEATEPMGATQVEATNATIVQDENVKANMPAESEAEVVNQESKEEKSQEESTDVKKESKSNVFKRLFSKRKSTKSDLMTPSVDTPVTEESEVIENIEESKQEMDEMAKDSVMENKENEEVAEKGMETEKEEVKEIIEEKDESKREDTNLEQSAVEGLEESTKKKR